MTLFDTAELYGGGTGSNEKIVGEAVKSFRSQVAIATKFGFDMADPTFATRDSRPEHIREVTENSLRYLQTDLHRHPLLAPPRSERSDRGRRGSG